MLNTSDGLNLYTQSWIVEKPVAQLFVIHGYAEHLNRYEHFAKFLNANQINVQGLDLRGHGQSDGERAYVSKFEMYLDDLDLYFDNHLNEQVPSFLFGHSMGGLIASAYFTDRRKFADRFTGAILSAPALMANQDLAPFLIKMSSILGALFPKLKTIALDPTMVSSDESVVAAYKNDPLNYTGKWKARMAAELIRKMKVVQSDAKNCHLPIFIGHGTSDHLAEIKGTEMFYKNCGSVKKNFKRYDGFYHELVNEPQKQIFMEDVYKWMLEFIDK